MYMSRVVAPTSVPTTASCEVPNSSWMNWLCVANMSTTHHGCDGIELSPSTNTNYSGELRHGTGII